jgi:DNA-binding HxlR family transcriptional regulator
MTNCGIEKTLKIIGDKWTVLIIRDLLEDKKRFGELETSLSCISPKTLSLRLKDLEKNGIITKKIYKEIPLHVEYSITEKGKSLENILNDLRVWGENLKE